MSETTELGTAEKLPYEKPELVMRERLYRIAAGDGGGGGGGGGVGVISPPGIGFEPPDDLFDPPDDNPLE